MQLSKIDTPEAFFKAIPKNVQENLYWRINEFTPVMVNDKEAQKLFFSLCLAKPQIFFNAVAFTLNPQMPPGKRNVPFILRPKQEVAVDVLVGGINNQYDIGIEKTRKEGATELVCKLFTLYTLLTPYSQFLVGSRKEELVDKTGNKYTLFAKIDHVIKCLPDWWKATTERTHCHLDVKETESCIDGEATNENFGAGARATSIMLDEFGRVDRTIAESIEGSVHDVSECIIYTSTHWLGSHHPFNKALRKSTTTVVTLPWYDNPEKNYGLYKSPDIDKIQIIDIDYYRRLCPEVFNSLEANQTFTYSKFERELLTLPQNVQDKLSNVQFIADGCETIPGDVRSFWHDSEEEKRKGHKRDFMSNIWMSPVGASDAVFDDVVLNRIKSTTIYNPDYVGEVNIIRQDGKVIKGQFKRGGRNRLQWWGKWAGSRPPQNHNYIIGCDPSFGVGSSNSVAAIYDVNTHEVCGIWACPNTPVELFADQVVALAYWVGGKTTPYIIWENNGGHGINFGRRILWNSYRHVYMQRTEEQKLRKKQSKYGWKNSTTSKSDLLGELGIALSEGLKSEPKYRACIIHDADALDELFDYIFLEGGEIEASKRADLTSGARQRHGDRVMAIGLCVLGTKDQAKASFRQPKLYNKHSFGARYLAWEEQQAKDNQYKRKFLF